MPKNKKRLALIVFALLLCCGLSLFMWSFVIEPDRVVVKEVTIALPEWPRAFDHLRIVAVSDLHVGSPHIDVDKLQQIVSMINQQHPDLVVLLGDFVIQGVWGGNFVGPEVTAGVLKDLRARMGVYAVLGNHDWWYDGFQVRRALSNADIRVLENDVTQVQQNGGSIWLVGLADLWAAKQDIPGTFAKITDANPVIVLSHNPDVFPQLPARAILTLAGHTHGGQVNLPIFGRRVVPSQFGQRYAIGHIQEGNRHLFVTPGIGTSIIPVRFRVPPEISVVTIISQ